EDRLDAHLSGLSYSKIQRGQLDVSEVKRLTEAQGKYAEMGSIFVEKPPLGERSVQHVVSRAREVGADVLLIDQLSFMESRRSHRDRSNEMSEIVFDLKAEISEDESSMLPTFLAVQFNRASMNLKRVRGGLQHIALSSAIEQTVDIAYGLYQP